MCLQCGQDSTIQDHLLSVLDSGAAPPPWDPQRTLNATSAAVYYISHQTPVKVGGGWRWQRDEQGRILRKQWVQVDPGTRLADLVRRPDHVVPGFPVLHVVTKRSSFEAHMLASDPSHYLPQLSVHVED